ncbi:MAG TPA: hypothetical protein VFE18_04165 [Phenylobacterium sp.]|jgi:hypothetical protein|uniref:HAAS signaling domain-containing protein n=1 Tax=Phenylobacterium sp. TaxID=1871053 RepID=UPI002D57127B|nr:hypothetical protein [Phenylobacterium sp.]HZZ67348.1 hypothetical protein [Phenylobacterium sp.]
MDLVNEYLRAVAALLPRAQREDIIAELRDTILSRIEEREADLGRPLTDDEVEAVLREVGHPVVIAARYREGPQHVVGPTLYPYWLFVVRVAIALQIATAVVVVFVRTVAFGDFSRALGQAIGSGVTGFLVLVGAATLVGWFMERRGARIDNLGKWRVRDLRYLEIAAWDFTRLREWIEARQAQHWREHHAPRRPASQPRGGGASGMAPAAPASAAASTASPRPSAQPIPPMGPPPWHPAMTSVARGLGFITLGTVLVLWWTGVMPLGLGLQPSDWAALDVDPGAFAKADWVALRAMLFWPVLAYATVVILQGAFMLAHPWAVRLQGLLEAVRGAALLGFCVWLWTISPLAPAIGVASGRAFFLRMDMFGQTPPLPLEPIATIVVLSFGFAACGLIFRGLWNLAFGGPGDYLHAPPPGFSNPAM